MDEQAQRAFLTRTREQADEILVSSHIGADVKQVIRDLMTIGTNLEQMMQQSAGQSADARVLKKKLDHAKAEARVVEERYDALKQKFVAMIEEIKVITIECQTLTKLVGADAASPGAQSIARIRVAIQKMAEAIIKVTKSS